MKSAVEAIQVLDHILNADILEKNELIKTFQNEIWADENITDIVLNDILSQLAYDLDFYEANESLRKESSNYYGNERLDEILKSSRQKLEDYERQL